MEFFTVTCEFNFTTHGNRYVESFLDKKNAIRFMEEMEKDFKDTCYGGTEFEVDDYTFLSDDEHGRVKHVHLESNCGEQTAYINMDKKTFKDGES
jgi:hypothetical protein